MRSPDINLLLVEPDDRLAELIAIHLERSLPALRVSRVKTGRDALDRQIERAGDIMLTDMGLADIDALSLTRQIRANDDCEVIFMTDRPTLGRAVEAMRLGVRDMFIKPFDLARLVHVVEDACERQAKRRHDQTRQRRLRRVASQLIRERRLVRKRVELICQDIVEAYRRLARKVVKNQHANASADGD